MGRIRTIKPEFSSNEELSSLSCQAHLLAAALLCYCDDEGYFNANPGLVRAGTLPLRDDLQNISGVLTELSRVGYVRLGKTPEGKRYGQVVHFSKHQRISHPTPSRISNLEIEWEDSGISPEDSVRTPDTFRPEGKGREGNRERNREGKMAGGILPEMLAKELPKTLGLAGGAGPGSLFDALYQVAQIEQTAGRALEDVAVEMEAAYLFYQQEKPKLRIQWGPAKFFAEGHWRNPDGWPRTKLSEREQKMKEWEESSHEAE